MVEFSEGQKAIIERTAWIVGEKILQDFREEIRQMRAERKEIIAARIHLHERECSVAKDVELIKNWPKQAKMFSKGFILGIVVVSSAVGSGMTLIAARIVKLFL